MENPSPNTASDRPPATVAVPAPAKKRKRALLVAIAAIAVLGVVGILLFFNTSILHKAYFSARCAAMAGTPVINEESCVTTYECLSERVPAQDAGAFCTSDLSCQGACVDRKPVDLPPPDRFGSNVCVSQFGCNKYSGECSATGSVFTYNDWQPGCGL